MKTFWLEEYHTHILASTIKSNTTEVTKITARMSEMNGEKMKLTALSMKPSKLALVAPDVALEKYIQIGLRPSLRKFDEFRPVEVSFAGLSTYEKKKKSNKHSKIIGSSVVKCGPTVVVCSVSAGIVEDSQELTNDYRLKLDKGIIDAERDENGSIQANGPENASIYTVVEVSKGRNGPPLPEEMSVSQSLYDTILHSGLIKKSSLKIRLGLKSKDKDGRPQIIRGEENDELLKEFAPSKTFSYVLYSKIQVYSPTGSLFDLCLISLLKALKETKLPEVYMTEKTAGTQISTNARSRDSINNGAFSSNLEQYNLLCDPKNSHHLEVQTKNLFWPSTFGVVFNGVNGENKDAEGDLEMSQNKSLSSALLADPEGTAEEEATRKIKVLPDGQENIFGIEVIGGITESTVTKADIKRAIKISQIRAKVELKHL